MIVLKRILFASLIVSVTPLISQVDELAECLVRITEKIEEIDTRGESFRISMMGNKSIVILDIFEKKFAELFSDNEAQRKELADACQNRDASIASVVAYVKDILKTADESKKKQLMYYVKNHAAELTSIMIYAHETVEKLVTELAQLRREISSFPSDVGRDKNAIDLKKAVTKIVDERYATWSRTLALIAQAEWKYAVAFEVFNK